MPRAPRVVIEGALCYVSVCAADGRLLFKGAEDYHTYLDLLATYQARHQVTIYAYALLPGQVHLCLELPSGEALSAFMHDLSSRYIRHANRRDSMTGPLFQQRFKSTLLEKVTYLAQMTRYVHLWPSYAQVASQAEAHRWTSISRYLRPEDVEDTLVHVAAAEALEAMRREQPAGSYADYLCALTDVAWAHFGDSLQRHHVLGSPDFLARAEALRPARRAVSEAAGASAEAIMVRPARPSRLVYLAVTVSLALGISAAVSAGLYARNVQALRTALRALVQERPLLPSLSGAAPEIGPGLVSMRPATFALPSRLNGTAWDIRLRAVVEGDALLQQDSLVFAGGQVRSRQLSAQGAAPSNYTLSTQADGSVVWQTMQTDAAGAVVCWRGEWSGETMRGIMSRQVPGSPATNFSFIGTGEPWREPPNPPREI